MYIDLKLNKYFIEPESKYICFSTCLFEQKKYIRDILNGNKFIKKNLTKINYFIKSLKKISNLLTNEYYPDNFYLRLYYNSKVIQNKKYNDLINLLKKNKKVQLIEYSIDDLFNSLIGTLVRFYTFFDEESKNIEYTICIDSDKVYNNKIIEIFEDFKKTNNLVYGISRLYYTPNHINDYQDTNDLFDFVKLIANFIIVKKNKIFNKKYWNRYFHNFYKQNDLMYLLNYNTFKEYSINSILNKNINNFHPYSIFQYGIDELWINFVLKKILLINNKKDKLDIYLCDITKINKKIIDNPKYQFDDYIKFLLKIKEYFEYNHIINSNILDYFIKDCSFLKIKSYNELIKFIDQLIYNFIIADKRSIKILVSFYNNIKKNKYLEMIYLDNNTKYIIKNYRDLHNKVGKYLIGELEF